MARYDKNSDEGMKKRCYTKMRHRCKHMNRYFDLDYEQFITLCEMDCAYCGGEPTKTLWKGYKTPWFANGLDRIDSGKGYSMDNVQPCCSMCNRLKSDLGEMDFLNHLRKISAFRKLGELTDE